MAIDILTDFPPGPEFQGRRVRWENFYRKGDFETIDGYRNNYFIQLLKKIEEYQAQLDNQQNQILMIQIFGN